MVVKGEDVKEVKDPAEPSPAKLDEVIETPPAEGDTSVTTPPAVEPVEPEEKVDDDPNEPKIPRTRLNEEIEKRKALEVELAKVQERVKNETPADQGKIIDQWAEQISVESGNDEYGNRILSPAQVKAYARLNHMFTSTATADMKVRADMEDFITANPEAEEYKKEIQEELNTIPKASQTHPRAIPDCYMKVLGKHYLDVKKKAFEEGKKKGMEQKRILSTATGEKATGSDGKKITDFGSQLSADEKEVADNSGISYKDYYEAKNRKVKK